MDGADANVRESSPAEMTNVFLALRSPLMGDAMNRLLTDAGITVGGLAHDFENALASLRAAHPDPIDSIIIDAAFCNEQSDALTSVREAAGPARVVILAYDTDVQGISSDHIMSADGVLTFAITSEALIESLRLILAGERVVPRELMHSLLIRALAEEAESAARTKEPSSPLRGRNQAPSPRETEILRHLLQGDSNKAIARELGITEATVKVHLKGLLRKISATNRTQAAIWAINNGYTAPEPRDPDGFRSGVGATDKSPEGKLQ